MCDGGVGGGVTLEPTTPQRGQQHKQNTNPDPTLTCCSAAQQPNRCMWKEQTQACVTCHAHELRSKQPINYLAAMQPPTYALRRRT